MNVSQDRLIENFLQIPVNRSLVDYYDPNQNLVRNIAASGDPLAPTFLEETIADRSQEAISVFGDRATGHDVVFADALDAGIAQSALAKLLSLNAGRRRTVEHIVDHRAHALASAIFRTTVETRPELFDAQNMPLNIEAYAALARTTAAIGHAHTGKDHKTQMRMDGSEYWTHIEGTAFIVRSALGAVAVNEPLAVNGTRQLVSGGHDAFEDGLKPDSSHWYTLPTIVSPRVVAHLTRLSRADNPKAAALAVYFMTRTRSRENGRLNYLEGYVHRGLSFLNYKGPNHETLVPASNRFREVKPADQRYNTVNTHHPSKRRVNEGYAQSIPLFEATAEPGSWYLDYLHEVQQYTFQDTVDNLKRLEFDAHAAAERVEHIFNSELHKAA